MTDGLNGHECTCPGEPGWVQTCPACGVTRLLCRDPDLLDAEAVAGYDPICGHTVAIPRPERGPTRWPKPGALQG